MPQTGQPYTVISYNIGFGAYEPDYGFFMDGGTESRAWSRERVTANVQNIASFLKERSAVRRLPGLAILEHRAGNRAAAEAALAQLVAEYGDNSHYQYAQIHAQWGDTARALESLHAAWDLRDGGVMLMFADPLLEPLRSTDDYLALAKAVGFV